MYKPESINGEVWIIKTPTFSEPGYLKHSYATSIAVKIPHDGEWIGCWIYHEYPEELTDDHMRVYERLLRDKLELLKSGDDSDFEVIPSAEYMARALIEQTENRAKSTL